VTPSAIERVNYVNGSRLEAADLRLEQAYHIGVRRRLNRALYQAGVAAGLEVTVAPDDPHRVVVSPGVALDEEGREIILLDPRTVEVTGIPSTTAGVVYGNYLVIAYAEEPVARFADGCGPPGARVTWGGPSRVRAEPVLRWRDVLPRPGSGEIVLAQAELDDQCAVRRLVLTVRRWVRPTEPSRVVPVSLEGEKDVDPSNPKLLYFHVRGGTPGSVVLHLRSAPMSTLYYSELGGHTHADGIAVAPVPVHSHGLGTITLSSVDGHDHTPIISRTEHSAPEDNGITTYHSTASNQNLTTRTGLTPTKAGGHTHTVSTGQRTADDGGDTPSITRTAAAAGAPDLNARAGATRRFLDGLNVLIDANNVTDLILGFLRGRDGAAAWPRLGIGGDSGGQVDRLAQPQGTGALDLVQLGLIDLGGEEHVIRLELSGDTGGRVLYNLYVA